MWFVNAADRSASAAATVSGRSLSVARSAGRPGLVGAPGDRLEGARRHEQLAEPQVPEEHDGALVERFGGRPDAALARRGAELVGQHVLAPAELGDHLVAEPALDGCGGVHADVGAGQRLVPGQHCEQAGAQVVVGRQTGAAESVEQLGLQLHAEGHVRCRGQHVDERLQASPHGAVDRRGAVGA